MILFNPTDCDIKDYPIEEAELDQYGKIIIGEDNTYRKTGRTLVWGIAPGEKVEFPDYVGQYLKHIYGFLEVVQPKPAKEGEETPELPSAQPQVAPSKTGGITCKFCGQIFSNERGLGLHFAARHRDFLIKS